MDALARLNALTPPDAEKELRDVCGSAAWARAMAGDRPYADREALLRYADEVWRRLRPADWLEAFGAHPRIGERANAASAGGRHAAWSEQEQSSARGAGADVLDALRAANEQYEERFGHVFLICATGRSAQEMLDALHERMQNDPATELRVAAEEQRKITRLRLEKMLSS